jgi:hypothetical protein
MAKIPSRGFSKTKTKIASRGFSKSKAKIPSRGFAKGNAKIASRKGAKPPAVAEKKPTTPALLDRPSDEQSREDRLAALQGQVKSLKPASDL